MTFYDAWVGERVADDHAIVPWQGPGVGTLPAPCSPPFPDGRSAWAIVRARMDEGRFRGGCVDFDAYACVVTKDEILALLDEVEDAHRRRQTLDEQAEERWRELRAYVDALSPGSYLLVTCAT